MEILARQKLFGGWQLRCQHFSECTQTPMTFSVFLPTFVQGGGRVPVVYCLAGLTCSDENFSTKSGAQQWAERYHLALVMPDTSPRGEAVTDNDSYDLGQGAGFYVNATQLPWAAHYQMYDYIVEELPKLIQKEFPVTEERSICGHSMGGHGALQIALKNAQHYAAVSAFAPIVNPSETPWGEKAFRAYLGNNPDDWAQYDSYKLLDTAGKLPILIDQGLADQFYPSELQPEKFAQKAQSLGFDIQLHLREGYDHSYYFISSFIESHMAFHARALGRC